MPFFKSFWRETGKNTGKWASNKVFGDNWSTPYRFSSRTEPAGKRSAAADFPDPDSDETPPSAPSGRIQSRELFEKVEGIQLDAHDTRVITQQLDELFLAAHQALEKRTDETVFLSKIRSGIHRLDKLGDRVSADFYRQELKMLNRSRHRATLFAVVVCLLSFGALAYIAFFQDMGILNKLRFWNW